MAKRRKSSKSETPMAEKVEAVLSSAEKDTSIKKLTHERKEKKNKYDPVDGSPLRSIFCLKKIVDMKRVEETEDCFIIDFNLFNPIDIAKFYAANNGDVDDELSVVAERGQVLFSPISWPVEIIHIQGIFVCNFHLILHLMRDIVACVTVMFAILLLLVSVGRHIAMRQTMSRIGDLNGG
ncbi:Nascent polypeptide-associated complex subunit alpha-like protein 2 [Hibiscus syriacus]|uniref:Nascent polypeptide-associated complex subunit alpha-like protein 2 n=1 Tax=Hibiscus syriacus TaxID=106335 RepID=A0A6A2ZTV9_HIBSY|nr:Nascent polypeptide-associated complex subunit alpha-like protein 2 [Hibiscus syriacus]